MPKRFIVASATNCAVSFDVQMQFIDFFTEIQVRSQRSASNLIKFTYQSLLESQPPHTTVNLLLAITNSDMKLTVL